MMFDVKKLVRQVFNPDPDERCVIIYDHPGDGLDNAVWRARRLMAAAWHRALNAASDFKVLPLVQIPATGSHNAPLSGICAVDGMEHELREVLRDATFAMALTEYSATAPLIALSKIQPDFRASSSPGVTEDMQTHSLAADWDLVSRYCDTLLNVMDGAEVARCQFSTGEELCLDLRYRGRHADNGKIHRGATGHRVGNLPAGEAFQALNEGETAPSVTAGLFPLIWKNAAVTAKVRQNQIVEVVGNTSESENFRQFLAASPARANIAELGLGCNPAARSCGVVLSDEKMGVHIAIGRSEHLGGTVGPSAFTSPAHVYHEDFVVHAALASLDFVYQTGKMRNVVKNGKYHPDLGIPM